MSTFLGDIYDFVFVSWGSDPVHFAEELEDKKLISQTISNDFTTQTNSFFDPRYVNLKVFDNGKRGLKQALKDYGFPVIGAAHRALDDAKSTAQLVKMWKVKGIDSLVNKNSSYRHKLTSKQNEMVVKFQKRVVYDNCLSIKQIHKLLDYCDWDYLKAKNVFLLINGIEKR